VNPLAELEKTVYEHTLIGNGEIRAAMKQTVPFATFRSE